MHEWLTDTGHPFGAIVSFEQMWALVQRWYQGRLAPDWRGRGAQEAQEIIDGVGLSGAFWQLK